MLKPPSKRNPYSGLPADRYWRTGVAEQHPFNIAGLYRKKFALSPKTKIATAGSCFAQHIGTFLRRYGYSVLDVEPVPQVMTDAMARKFGYRIYSARYGNIYLVEQLLQVTREALTSYTPSNWIWEKDGRYYDAMRPSVEPTGLGSPDEVIAHRKEHLAAVRRMFETADVFVFTLGLTEGWIDRATGTAYPTAPGVIAGEYDPAVFAFKNYRAAEIRKSFLAFRDLVHKINPRLKFLLTVSPVPLTATATQHHVLQATTYSKSVLRTVAGELTEDFDDIDYFPSYEIVASPVSRGFFYSPNLREVEQQGVRIVMNAFFREHPPIRRNAQAAAGKRAKKKEDLVCEEKLLEAFQ